MRILEAEGLIAYGPTRRPVVADPSLEEINDWLRVQGALEALAGELACDVASDKAIAEIERLNEAIKGARDSEGPSLKLFAATWPSMTPLLRRLAIVHCLKLMPRTMPGSGECGFLSSQRVVSRDVTRREHEENCRCFEDT